MRVAVEVLRRELEELRILECFHLVHQAARYIHALSDVEFELFDCRRVGRLFDTHL